MGLHQPSYAVVREQGPQHSKTFTVEVRVRRPEKARPEFTGQAEGSTKKKGEQAAAKTALQYLQAMKKESIGADAKKTRKDGAAAIQS